jgi:protein gp37
MAEASSIEWTDSTFNPWIGCTKVSPGCEHCYAEAMMDTRLGRARWGPGQARQRTSASNWRQPLLWEKHHEAFELAHGRRRRVFCASLADVFDNEVDPAWRDELIGLIVSTPNLDWLLLTKRIGNVPHMLKADAWQHLPNVWLGATVVNQAEADRDIPKLLAVPARVRFLSIEPMLQPIDLWRHLPPHCERHPPPLDADGKCEVCEGRGIWSIGAQLDESEKAPIRRGLDWVICGGESGPNARPMHPDWVRMLRDQCTDAGVPFLFKQWGEWAEQDSDKPTRVFSMDTDVGETLASRCDGFISLAGEFVRDMDEATTDLPYRGLVRIGKKAAGRLLDGMTHDGFPRAAG